MAWNGGSPEPLQNLFENRIIIGKLFENRDTIPVHGMKYLNICELAASSNRHHLFASIPECFNIRFSRTEIKVRCFDDI